MAKGEMIETLRGLLRASFELSAQGSDGATLRKAQGLVDGYMRAMIDAELCTERELCALAADERERARGPAIGAMDFDDVVTRAA